MLNLGEFVLGASVYVPFNTSASTGASVTVATNPTIRVYEQGSTTEITAGASFSEDYDTVTGVHYAIIDTSNAAYGPAKQYYVQANSATIDGVSVSAWIGTFNTGRVSATTPVIGYAQSGSTSSTVKLPSTASATDDIFNGAIATIEAGTGAGQSRYISDYVGSTKVASVSPNWTTTPDTTSVVRVTSVAPIATTDTTALANAVVEAEITALKTYNRSANTTATIDGPTSGTTSFGVTVDASYDPIKTL